jgi:hypothetical protein
MLGNTGTWPSSDHLYPLFLDKESRLKTMHLLLGDGGSLRLDSASYQGKLAAQPHSVGKVASAAGR